MLGTDVLRERTAEAHLALEDSDLILPATRERTRLACLVGAMFSFHRAVERELARFGEALASHDIDVHAYAKSQTLRGDALALASPEIPEPHFALGSSGEAAGALYVVEGSTLGGTQIAGEIRRHLAFESRYYGCYGSATAARWRDTRARIDRFVASAAHLDAAVAGATYTFRSLRAHLSDQELLRGTR